MRLSHRARITAVLATATIALAGCSTGEPDTDAPVLTTMATSEAEATADESSEQADDDKEPNDKKKSDDKDDKDDKAKDEKKDSTSDNKKDAGNDKKDKEKADKDNGKRDDKVDMARAPEGTHCGEFPDKFGDPLTVVALADNTDCETGLKVVQQYLSPNPPGTPPQGSAGIWESPEGWMCSSRVIPPGMPDEPGTRHIGCGPNNSDRSVILYSADEL